MTSHDLKTSLNITILDKDKTPKTFYRLDRNIANGSTVHFKVTSKDGRVKVDKSIPFRSYVKNGGYLWYTVITSGGVQNFPRETDGDYFYMSHSSHFEHDAGAGDDDFGIWVGTDDGTILPAAQDNYNLGAKISDGTGAGQLEYGETTIGSLVDDGNDRYFDIERNFLNNSGNPITINETGLVCHYYRISHTTEHRYFLTARDLNDINDSPVNVTVNDGDDVTITYRMRITESSGYNDNFATILRTMYHNNTGLSVRTIHGDYHGFAGSSNVWYTAKEYIKLDWNYGNLETEDDYGIIIGSGTSAVSINDYTLEKISHGIATSGTMYYHKGMHHNPSRDNEDYIYTTTSGVYFFQERCFSNLTDAAIDVNEVGFAGEGITTDHHTMWARFLTGGITIEPDESMFVNAEFMVETH